MLVTHLAWVPNARMSAAGLTIAAGVAHGLAGAIAGRRLFDTARTQTSLQAAFIGALTSLLAVVLFSPAFVIFLRATDVRPSSAASYFLLTILTGLFSFLGVGWALVLVSVGVGWGLYRLAVPRSPA